MAKALFRSGKIFIVKTVEDVIAEYEKLTEKAKNKYLETQILFESDEEKIEKAKQAYKSLLLRREDELKTAKEYEQGEDCEEWKNI